MANILSQKVVTIRKPCRCDGCYRKFTAGTQMRKVNSVEGRELQTSAWCPTCDEYWSRYMDRNDEICCGALLNCDKDWKEIDQKHKGENE